MALFRRNKTWWTDFSVHGQRYRQSVHTTDWREAQAREKELITQASEGKLAPSSQQFARLAFSEAANRYLADRLAHLAERSIQTERERLKPLRGYFGATPLTRIAAEEIRAYIAHRKAVGVANKTVNLELGVVRGILKRAKRWHLIAEDVKPLPVRHDLGQALSHGEKVRLLKTAEAQAEVAERQVGNDPGAEYDGAFLRDPWPPLAPCGFHGPHGCCAPSHHQNGRRGASPPAQR